MAELSHEVNWPCLKYLCTAIGKSGLYRLKEILCCLNEINKLNNDISRLIKILCLFDVFKFTKRLNRSFKRDIYRFDFLSNFFVSISCLINIRKEMSLPGLRSNM